MKDAIDARLGYNTTSPELTVSPGLTYDTVFIDQPLEGEDQTIVLAREQYLELREALDEYFEA